MAVFKKEALEIVERNLASWKSDIERDMSDCLERINDGSASRDDQEELDILGSELIILKAFDQVLVGVRKGV